MTQNYSGIIYRNKMVNLIFTSIYYISGKFKLNLLISFFDLDKFIKNINIELCIDFSIYMKKQTKTTQCILFFFY